MAEMVGGPARRVLGDADLRRLVVANLLAVVAEWASAISVLVYAYDRGGSRATGLASLAVLAPVLVGAPIAASLIAAHRPQTVRRAGLLVQAVGYAVAAGAAAAGTPVVVVVLGAVVALGALSTVRPTAAVLLPAMVRTTSELTASNLVLSYASSASALVGPLAAAGLLWLGGPAAGLAGCAAALVLALLVSSLGTEVGSDSAGEEPGWQPGPMLAGAVATLRSRPWTAGILAVVAARSAVVGALDVLLVVLALGALDLGQGGAGLLSALVGAGAVASAGVVAVVVRRNRLAPWLAAGLATSALLCVLLGVVTVLPVAVLVLPLLGLGVVLLDSLGRMLLQRAADPRVLGSLFSLLELVGGIGLLVGSGLAQVLIAVADESAALFGLAALLGLVLVASLRSVLRADAGADVPVVEMSLLQDLPMFAPLPPIELEAVARTAEHVVVPAGEVVIEQGGPGDRFYAVAGGSFAVVMSGEHIRAAERGSWFGEVALLADVPRTATVTAETDGELLAVERVPFLVAVTGHDTSRAAAWGVVRSLRLDTELPAPP